MDSRDLFLSVLEAGRSQVKMLADLVSGENPLPGSQAEGGSKSSWDFWAPPSRPHLILVTSQRHHPQF